MELAVGTIPHFQIGVENRAYRYLSRFEIAGGKRIYQHLSDHASVLVVRRGRVSICAVHTDANPRRRNATDKTTRRTAHNAVWQDEGKARPRGKSPGKERSPCRSPYVPT
jgi:hypothetical protein